MIKKLLSLSLLAVVGACHAQTFNTVSFNTTNGATATFSSTGNTYRALISGFTLNGGTPVADIAWVYDFTSAPVPAFTAVTITISGTLSSGSVRVVGNEKVFDMAGAPLQVANGLIDETAVADASGTFSIIRTFNFSQAVSIGQAQKDLLHILGNGDSAATVTMIEQTFTPVPEPATLLALGCGAAALLRRRRRS
ncbi:MAG TPA: PEP-CTERM sorting domain-containing protein [Fimbriimonadaceae bacterium]|nr:PEP-CTERM sorting domain-containing protein [Fimbriimonadaceae bacterium]